MKTLSVSFVGLFVGLFAVVFFAHAQTTTEEVSESNATASPATEETEAHQVNRAERIEERQAAVQERQEVLRERKVFLNEQAQKRITNLAANISNRIDALIDRYKNIMKRLKDRTSKLEQDGYNVESAWNHIMVAQEALDEAATSVAGIDMQVAAFTSSENPRESWTYLKDTFVTVSDALRRAHSALKNAVNTLKNPVKQGADVVVGIQEGEEILQEDSENSGTTTEQ